MQTEQRLLYASPNGDRWHLVREIGSGTVFVRHTANEASGGNVVNLAIPIFLGLGRHGPEHQELWRLIGDLAAGGVDAAPGPSAATVEPTSGEA